MAAPNPSKNIKAKKAKALKVKKSMSKGAAVLVCVVVFIFLLGGLFAALLTDALGLGQKLISLMPAQSAVAADIEKQKKDIASEKAKLQSQAGKNEADATANQKEADRLKAAQDALAAEKQAFEAEKKDALSAEERQKAVLDIFRNLNYKKAAEILGAGYTPNEAANLLVKLPRDISAGILAEMDAAKAAQIAKLIWQ
jgi:flagellar motility protein MotE (MotC chaperone)